MFEEKNIIFRVASRTTFLSSKDLIVNVIQIQIIVGLMIEIIYTSCLRLILTTLEWIL